MITLSYINFFTHSRHDEAQKIMTASAGKAERGSKEKMKKRERMMVVACEQHRFPADNNNRHQKVQEPNNPYQTEIRNLKASLTLPGQNRSITST